MARQYHDAHVTIDRLEGGDDLEVRLIGQAQVDQRRIGTPIATA